jgi:hypothetical protein
MGPQFPHLHEVGAGGEVLSLHSGGRGLTASIGRVLRPQPRDTTVPPHPWSQYKCQDGSSQLLGGQGSTSSPPQLPGVLSLTTFFTPPGVC